MSYLSNYTDASGNPNKNWNYANYSTNHNEPTINAPHFGYPHPPPAVPIYNVPPPVAVPTPIAPVPASLDFSAPPPNFQNPPPSLVYPSTSATYSQYTSYPSHLPQPNYPLPTFTRPPPPIPDSAAYSAPYATVDASISQVSLSIPQATSTISQESQSSSTYQSPLDKWTLDTLFPKKEPSSPKSRRQKHSRSRSPPIRKVRKRSRSRSHDRKECRAYKDRKYTRTRSPTRSPSRRRRSPSPRGSSRYYRDEKTKDRYSVSSRNSSTPSRHYSRHRENIQPRVKSSQASTNESNSSENPERRTWTRSTPAELFYVRDVDNSQVVRGTPRLIELCNQFNKELIQRAARAKADRPPYEPPPRRHKPHLHKCRTMPGTNKTINDDSSCSSTSDSSSSEDEEDCSMRELERKRLHPDRLHPELWFNDPGEMNDGPLCRCSAKARRSGIRHGIYAGESPLPPCDPNINNAGRLHHYRITIAPPTNFLTKLPTIIRYDEHEYIFEGFSMFSHAPLARLPTCKVIRFNIQYTVQYVKETPPENFTISELNLFFDYLFRELLELVDLDFKAAGDENGCPRFHFMPRFVRDLPENGIEILSMNQVLTYLLNQSKSLIEEEALASLLKMPQYEWQNFADQVKGMLVTYPGTKPCSLRVDQIDREQQTSEFITFPEIVHFGIRPPQLSYAGNPEYQREWREYVKLRHLLANMPKPSFEDKRRLESKENRLQEMRMQSRMKRDVTVAVSAQYFYRTGIMGDMVQHALLVPVLVCHLRFHQSLDQLEKVMGYEFQDRYLLQLALTHPSYRENFGTNPDHARNSLTNCGIRQPEYGDRSIHYVNTRKRGINTLINIMSQFGNKSATESKITHNERLEFLGDAVVEFITSIHLFFMFPDLEEGGLATYRAAIVQNQHLAVLAKTLKLEEYMLYAHGSDLCHDLELRHAMANCFEALMGALFLDGGIEVADKVFAETFLRDQPNRLDVWENVPKHPLQEQEPNGDRHWIEQFNLLKKLTKFEESIGVQFTHIRLLARAFTDRSIGYTNLTLGSNQRLEFLGDTVLQLIASDYLYKHFPEHHEGHLSLLRSSLVNNRTQAVVCDDLGMTQYAIYSTPKGELKTKDRADLLEAFLGSLYVDKDLDYCVTFCYVCFFPRLRDFIMNQDWNDPKSKLQQCCLTLRTMDGGEPDIPVYKVIECKGPTNTRIYTVAVYFRRKRLATATGHSIQMAEMNAAKSALQNSEALFPQLNHQKRVIAKSMKKQRKPHPSKDRNPAPNSSDKTPNKSAKKVKRESIANSNSSSSSSGSSP